MRRDVALVAAAAALLSWALVGIVRAYAVRARVLDHPNERSSHTIPTPRGGGLGLVLAFILTSAVGGMLGGVLRVAHAAALAAVALVALVGWVDDRRSLPVLPRLGAHLVAGAVVAWLAATSPAPAWAAGPLLLLYLAWWLFWTVSAINVVNFVDGIDGLIGSQAAVFALCLAARAPDGGAAGLLAASLAAACGGFLFWNWPPARIFLGDVGSGALGVAVCLTGLVAMAEGGAGFVRVFLPLLPIFLDATVTVLRRARAGERITTPHRSHLYQRLANGRWGHARVSTIYLAAALAGAATALAAPTRGRWGWFALYAALVWWAGWLLDRRVPHAPVARPGAASAG